VITEANACVIDSLLMPYGASVVRFIRFTDEYGLFVRADSLVHRRLRELLKLSDKLQVLSGEQLYRCKRRRTISYIKQRLEQIGSYEDIPLCTAVRGYRYCETYDDTSVQSRYSCDVYTPDTDLLEQYWVSLGIYKKIRKTLRQQRLFRVY
jgi:hypothetical protein